MGSIEYKYSHQVTIDKIEKAPIGAFVKNSSHFLYQN